MKRGGRSGPAGPDPAPEPDRGDVPAGHWLERSGGRRENLLVALIVGAVLAVAVAAFLYLT